MLTFAAYMVGVILIGALATAMMWETSQNPQPPIVMLGAIAGAIWPVTVCIMLIWQLSVWMRAYMYGLEE